MANTTVGLKIGSSSLKFVEILHKKDKHRLKKLGIEHFPFSEKQEGYVNHTSFLAERVREVISNNKLNPKRIVSGVEGESVVVRVIRIPFMKESELREAIRWEAEEHLPYPIEEISLDYHVLKKDLLGSEGKEMSVMLAGVKKESIDEHLQIFQQAGFCPAMIDVNSLALYNGIENSSMGKMEGICLINMGHYVTNLAVLTENHPFLVRDIKFGGDDITRSLAQNLGISYGEAEVLKKSSDVTEAHRQAGVQIREGEIGEIVRNSLSELIKEVVRSFEYFTSNREGSPVRKVLFSGGSSLISNIENILSQELEVPVQKTDPFDNIVYQKTKFQDLLPVFSSMFAVPVGLGLRRISMYD